MSFSLSNISTNIEKIQFNVKKNSPLIMTITGIVGLGATALLAYKAHKKVTAIVEDVEDARKHGDEVNAPVIVAKVGLALAPTILVGGLSIASIFGSYHVLTNRNGLLASALATVTAENNYIKRRVHEKYPDALLAPAEKEETKTITDKDGNEKKVTVVTPKDVPSMEGVWFHTSDEYVRDDLNYDQTFISTKERLLDNKLNDRGFLSMNEMYAVLGIPTTKLGDSFGWTEKIPFELSQQVFNVTDESGYSVPDIYISWPPVVSLYNKVDYTRDINQYWY